MRFLKPLWLNHSGEKRDFEVYSCHVSPDGKRLATAAGDGYVRIWSTEAIYRADDATYKGPRQLAALSYHSGTIHTVRFSGSNKYLASGADDKVVCVYVLEPGPPAHSTFGSNEAPPVENWRIYRRLIGHENDVQDLGWSPDSSVLASVGLDSRIVIWSGYTFEKLKTISQHGSHVKGISFDPANKLFATASDDRTMKIFSYTPPQPNSSAHDQTNNFMLNHTITTPFAQSPLTTYFRRCSWSPDGRHLAAANAVNGPVTVVAIVNRGTYESDVSFIGHEKPAEVCAFSPVIYSKTPLTQYDKGSADPSKGGVMVVATGGQDKRVTIWNTSETRPVCPWDYLSSKSISDLAWSPDGQNLFITSLDGSIICAIFAEGELGYPIPKEVTERSLDQYGAGRKAGIPEGPEGLLLEEKSKTDELKSVQGRMGELMGDAQPGINADLNNITKSSETNGIGTKASDNTSLTNGHASTEGQSEQQPPKEDPNQARIDKLKNRVTITKDGKKRMQPLLVSSLAGTTESSLPRSQLMSSNDPTTRNDAPQSILDLSKPFDGLPKGGLASMLIGNKRKYAETGTDDDNTISQTVAGAEREGATAVVGNTPDGLSLLTPDAANSAIQSRPSILHPSLMVSQIRLAVPHLRAHITRPLLGPQRISDKSESNSANGQDSHTLEVRNTSSVGRASVPGGKEPARVTVTRKGQRLWQDFLPKPVLLVTGNPRFWAAACEDGTLHIWSPAGRRLFNAFALESQPVILDCRGPYLLCVTAIGLCHVWNVITSSSPHPPVSVSPCLDLAAQSQAPQLTVGPSIIFARLTSEGRIIVAMSNGEAFTYSTALYTWQRLSEPWWAVGSQYWNTADPSGATQSSATRTNDPEEDDEVRPENIAAGVIPLLERNTTSQVLLRGRSYLLQRLVKALLSAEGYEGFESGVSVAHLENRVAAALTLGAKDEFKVYLSMYAKRLGAEGSRLKIEELLRSLVTGMYEAHPDASNLSSAATGLGSSSSKEICGWDKTSLLREVVLILGKYRDLQRVIVPYARLLGLTDQMSEGDNSMDVA